MTSLAEIRQKYPQYDHVDDETLANALYEKHYSHVHKEQFYEKIGFKPENKETSEGTNVPRSLLAGYAAMGKNLYNTPHDSAQGLEEGLKPISEGINKSLPMEKYLGNKPKENKSALQKLVEEFNLKNKVPESLQNKKWDKSVSERIPHLEDFDYAKSLGQKGEGTTLDKIIQKGVEHAPELASIGALAKHLNVINKAGDLLPILKSIASKPYKKQIKILED